MCKKSQTENVKSEELINEYEILLSKLQRIHNFHIDMATRSGFALHAARIAMNNFEIICDNLNEHPEYGPVMSSAYESAISMNQMLVVPDIDFIEDVEGMTTISHSLLTTCSTSGSIANTIDKDSSSSIDTPSFLKADGDVTYEKLKKLNPPLAETYREIEQVYYATNADNIRAALSMMRQAFDHFFNILAPDVDVRFSNFWEEKTGEENPLLVTRRERIKYAIAKKIKNPENAIALTNDIDLIVKSYKVLNEFHKRGELNEKSVKKGLFSVKHFIEDFAGCLR